MPSIKNTETNITNNKETNETNETPHIYKLNNLLTKINKNSTSISSLIICDPKRYKSVLMKLEDMQRNLVSADQILNSFNELVKFGGENISEENLGKNVVCVKRDGQTIAPLGKCCPKENVSFSKIISNISYTNNPDLRNPEDVLQKHRYPLDLSKYNLNQNIINNIRNKLFIDLKMHAYRTYEEFPSLIFIIFNLKTYLIDYNDKQGFVEILKYLRAVSISTYAESKEFLVNCAGFEPSLISVLESDLIDKNNNRGVGDIDYVDWRIRPVSLVERYLLCNISNNYKINNINIIENENMENTLEGKIRTLLDSLALENDESPEYILPNHQLDLLLKNRHTLKSRTDIDRLLKLQSPLFRSHVMDFLLLLNDRERVFKRICAVRKQVQNNK